MCLEVSERKRVKAKGKSGRVSHFPSCKVERECGPMRTSRVAATFWAKRQVRKRGGANWGWPACCWVQRRYETHLIIHVNILTVVLTITETLLLELCYVYSQKFTVLKFANLISIFGKSIVWGICSRNVNDWFPEAHSALITWPGYHTLCREIAYPTTACARSAALWPTANFTALQHCNTPYQSPAAVQHGSEWPSNTNTYVRGKREVVEKTA